MVWGRRMAVGERWTHGWTDPGEGWNQTGQHRPTSKAPSWLALHGPLRSVVGMLPAQIRVVLLGWLLCNTGYLIPLTPNCMASSPNPAVDLGQASWSSRYGLPVMAQLCDLTLTCIHYLLFINLEKKTYQKKDLSSYILGSRYPLIWYLFI